MLPYCSICHMVLMAQIFFCDRSGGNFHQNESFELFPDLNLVAEQLEQLTQRLQDINLCQSAVPGANKPKSCKDILDGGKQGELQDGVFTIRGGDNKKLKVYCDMTRDGGGWTLITATRTSYGWTKETVYERNVANPSLSQDYSILGKADAIKNQAKGKTFMYRIEANGRGRWGGIWEAPVIYSFSSTTDEQAYVNLIKKFDSWDYSSKGIEKRMPWISTHDTSSLLTTNRKGDGHWWGTLIMKDNVNELHRQRYNVAPWIKVKVTKTNEIYYWLREN